MKKITMLLSLLACYSYSKAQSESSGASQSMSFNMQNVVSAGFGGSGGGNGGSSNVNIPINGLNALSDGIESPEIEINFHCTSDFDVSVAASSTNFTYSGPSTSNTTMPVKDVLSIMITNNNTEGSISNGYDEFKPINGMESKLAINSGKLGVRKFSFKYKATPGFEYPAGTYTTDIVYTVVKK